MSASPVISSKSTQFASGLQAIVTPASGQAAAAAQRGASRGHATAAAVPLSSLRQQTSGVELAESLERWHARVAENDTARYAQLKKEWEKANSEIEPMAIHFVNDARAISVRTAKQIEDFRRDLATVEEEIRSQRKEDNATALALDNSIEKKLLEWKALETGRDRREERVNHIVAQHKQDEHKFRVEVQETRARLNAKEEELRERSREQKEERDMDRAKVDKEKADLKSEKDNLIMLYKNLRDAFQKEKDAFQQEKIDHQTAFQQEKIDHLTALQKEKDAFQQEKINHLTALQKEKDAFLQEKIDHQTAFQKEKDAFYKYLEDNNHTMATEARGTTSMPDLTTGVDLEQTPKVQVLPGTTRGRIGRFGPELRAKPPPKYVTPRVEIGRLFYTPGTTTVRNEESLIDLTSRVRDQSSEEGLARIRSSESLQSSSASSTHKRRKDPESPHAAQLPQSKKSKALTAEEDLEKNWVSHEDCVALKLPKDNQIKCYSPDQSRVVPLEEVMLASTVQQILQRIADSKTFNVEREFSHVITNHANVDCLRLEKRKACCGFCRYVRRKGPKECDIDPKVGLHNLRACQSCVAAKVPCLISIPELDEAGKAVPTWVIISLNRSSRTSSLETDVGHWM
jgi:hypothetical protein